MKIFWFIIGAITGSNTGRNLINGERISPRDYMRAIHLIHWINQPVVTIILSIILLLILAASILAIITVEHRGKRALIIIFIIISAAGLISLMRIHELSPQVTARFKSL